MRSLYICKVETDKGLGDVLRAGTPCSIDDYFSVVIVSEDFSEYTVAEWFQLRVLLEEEKYRFVNFTVRGDNVYPVCDIDRSDRTNDVWQGMNTFKVAGSIWALLRELLELDALVSVDGRTAPLSSLSTSRFTNNVFVKVQNREVVNNRMLFDTQDIMKYNRKLIFYLDCNEDVIKDLCNRYIGVSYQRNKDSWMVVVSMHNQMTFPSQFTQYQFSVMGNEVLVAATQYDIEVCKMEKLALYVASQIMKVYHGVQGVTDIVSQRRRDIDLQPVPISIEVSVKKPSMLQFVNKLHGSESEMFLARLRRVINDKKALFNFLHATLNNINTNGTLSDIFEKHLADLIYRLRDEYDPFLIKELAYAVDKQQARLNLAYAELKPMIYEYNLFSVKLINGFDYQDMNLAWKLDSYKNRKLGRSGRGGL